MKSTKEASKWVLAGMFFLGITAHGQNLIQDGSFESPQQSAPGIYLTVTPAGWSGGVRLFNGNGNQTIYPSPEQGNQYEGIEASSLSQVFNVVSGGTYLLTWYDNSTRNDLYSDSVNINAGNLLIYSNSFQSLGDQGWNKHSVTFGLAAGSDTLTFTGGHEGISHFIDDVTLVQVPEQSSSLALFGLSLGFMALIGRTVSISKSWK